MSQTTAVPRPGYLAPVAVLAALGCIAGAWLTPVLVGRAFLVFEQPLHMWAVFEMLVRSGEVLVAWVVLTFALVFPVGKLVLLLAGWGLLRAGLAPPRVLFRALEAVGKWSMLDVFVAALVIVTLKISGDPTVSASTGPAVAFLLSACLLTALANRSVVRSAGKVTGPKAVAEPERMVPTFRA